jgi:hypothetical protein
MRLFFVTLIFFLFLPYFPVFAQGTEVTPNNSQYGNSYIPGYCIIKLEILAPSDDIYICTYVGTTYFYGSNSQTVLDQGLYNNCWQTQMASSQSGMSGILLKRNIFSSFILPQTYSTPCILKSEADPDEVCNQPIDVNGLVRSAFGYRFPLDLFQGFEPLTAAPTCPSLTITGQTFQLCYLNNLVSSLKYVLLLVFIISSVMAL